MGDKFKEIADQSVKLMERDMSERINRIYYHDLGIIAPRKEFKHLGEWIKPDCRHQWKVDFESVFNKEKYESCSLCGKKKEEA